MPGPSISDFTNIAATNANRLVATDTDVEAPENSGRGRRAVARSDQTTLEAQNVDTITKFRAALRQSYGRETANTVYDTLLRHVETARQPLTSRLVKEGVAMGVAISQRAGIQDALTKEFGAMVAGAVMFDHCHSPAYDPNAQVSMSDMMRLRDDATRMVAAQRTGAQQQIQRLDAAKTAALSSNPLDQVATQTSVQTAMANLNAPCQERLAIYRPALEKALAEVARDFNAIDQTGNPAGLLTKVGNEMAKKLDELVLEAVFIHAKDNGEFGANGLAEKQTGTYAGLMAGLGANPLEELGARYPAFMEQLTTTGNQLAQSLGEIARHVHTDIAAAPDGSDLGARFAGATADGLSDIHLTDSDPHKGGHRVAILTLHTTTGGEQKVVYKPRDVRVDAKLVGGNNLPGVGQSLRDYTDTLLQNRGASLHLPSYRFLAKQTPAGEHYGYVEHLSNGTVGDQLLNPTEARELFQNLGRQVAMLAFAGARDLHHTNIMISDKQPCFTDLELSFDSEVMRLLDPGSGNPPGSISTKMQVNMALTSHGQLEWQPSAFVDPTDGKLTYHEIQSREHVKENFFHVTGQLGDGTQLDGNNRTHKRIFEEFAPDFRFGFREVIDAFSAESTTNPNAFNHLIDGFAGMQIRYHPVGTPEHLSQVNGLRLRGAIQLPDHGTAINERTAHSGLNTVLAVLANRPAAYQTDPLRLAPFHVQDWQRGDVPLFVRPLGSGQVLHDGRQVITRQDGSDYFADDPLQDAKDAFGRLHDDTTGQRQRMLDMGEDLFQSLNAHVPPGTPLTQEELDPYEAIVGPQPGVHL